MHGEGTTRELSALVAARTLSVVGDQVARVALSATVLARTGSALLAALTFAATFLPAVLGTALLSGLADRYPRRRVLLAGDLVRAGLVALMAVPHLPLTVLLGLVLLVTLVDGPAGAASGALLRTLSGSDARYQRVTAWDETCTQAGWVAGYLLGGLAVATVGVGPALLGDAGTFLLRAAVLVLLVRPRPAPSREGAAPHAGQDLRVGLSAVLSRPARLPVLLTWVTTAAAIAPEALALSWARDLGVGTVSGGLLLAANPVGSVVGLLVLARVSTAAAGRAMVPLVTLALGPLLLAPAVDSLPLLLLLVALSGTGLTLTTIARTRFVSAVPDAVRGRAFGVAGTGIVVGQGLGVALAGVVADSAGAATAVAVCAAVGGLLVGLVLLDDRRAPTSLTVAPPRPATPGRLPLQHGEDEVPWTGAPQQADRRTG